MLLRGRWFRYSSMEASERRDHTSLCTAYSIHPDENPWHSSAAQTGLRTVLPHLRSVRLTKILAQPTPMVPVVRVLTSLRSRKAPIVRRVVPSGACRIAFLPPVRRQVTPPRSSYGRRRLAADLR